MPYFKVAVVLLIISALACAEFPGKPNKPRRDDKFGAAFMVSVLRDELRQPEIVNQPIVVATFIDLNNLDKSSIFGRVLGERLLTELHQAGFTVAELRKGKDLFIRKEIGELALSDEAKEILGQSNARAVLAGTYVVTEKTIIINARLIDVAAPLILSSCSYDLKLNKDLSKMLSEEENI